MKITKDQIQSELATLENLVSQMDIPVYRRRNVSWLKKHLALKNENHRHFQEAMEIIERLLSHGVSHG